MGWRKASIEHFTLVKAAWTLWQWKIRRFQEKENQPSVFYFFFGRCKKEKKLKLKQ